MLCSPSNHDNDGSVTLISMRCNHMIPPPLCLALVYTVHVSSSSRNAVHDYGVLGIWRHSSLVISSDE